MGNRPHAIIAYGFRLPSSPFVPPWRGDDEREDETHPERWLVNKLGIASEPYRETTTLAQQANIKLVALGYHDDPDSLPLIAIAESVIRIDWDDNAKPFDPTTLVAGPGWNTKLQKIKEIIGLGEPLPCWLCKIKGAPTPGCSYCDGDGISKEWKNTVPTWRLCTYY